MAAAVSSHPLSLFPSLARAPTRAALARRALLCAVLPLLACSQPEPVAPPPETDYDLAMAPPDLARMQPPPPPDLAPPRRPMYLNGSFDGGSSPFQSWVATLTFARELLTTYKKPLHLTYFVTTAFYDTTVTGSIVGRAASQDEILVRWALTQQALNEGHEIANHTVRHLDGETWTAAQWRAELKEFQGLVVQNLFVPVLDEKMEPVFPRWRPLKDAAAGAVGAACSAAKDCQSGLSCAMVTPRTGFCTRECNDIKPCPTGTFCGYPEEPEPDRDICLPKPEYPVMHQGQELFFADGTPNLAHPALHPYVPVGFRAPQLSTNDAMYQVLAEMHYAYDASQVDEPDLPYHQKSGTLEFSLMPFPGALAIPMDYNYMVHMDTDGSIMEKDYKNGILTCYEQRDRMPWNIGHHLRNYSGGAYFETFKRVFRYAAQGCPDAKSVPHCPDIEFPSLRELNAHYR